MIKNYKEFINEKVGDPSEIYSDKDDSYVNIILSIIGPENLEDYILRLKEVFDCDISYVYHGGIEITIKYNNYRKYKKEIKKELKQIEHRIKQYPQIKCSINEYGKTLRMFGTYHKIMIFLTSKSMNEIHNIYNNNCKISMGEVVHKLKNS